jgi:hypothetical protein
VDAQAKHAEAAEDDGTINSQLLASPGKFSVPANQSTQSSMPEDLWSAAYGQLGSEEQRVLSEIQLSTASNDKDNPLQTALVINEVIQLTEKQYENFQQRVNGSLRESCQNIINAALSFKDIIGAVAASDPTNHAASAWAVVSLGLTVCNGFQSWSVMANSWRDKIDRPEPSRSPECAICIIGIPCRRSRTVRLHSR